MSRPAGPAVSADGLLQKLMTAAELVRFWGEPPLVREPDITLCGIERLDPPEQEFLNKSPMRRALRRRAFSCATGLD